MSSDQTGWGKAVGYLRSFEGRWVFRGDTIKQKGSDSGGKDGNVVLYAGSDVLNGGGDGPSTGLQRACAAWDPGADPVCAEEQLLDRFRRTYPTWENPIPLEDDDTLGWLALMQHYGTPTRLLDCTYSPFVAAYFALEKLLGLSDEHNAVVWAFNSAWFEHVVPGLLPGNEEQDLLERIATRRGCEDRESKPFDELFRRPKRIKFVYPVNPLKLNERLVRQQGVFLCPGDVNATFEVNLQALDPPRHTDAVRRLEMGREVLREGLEELHRMNVNRATLFPGLAGYAESFKTQLGFLERTGP